MRQTLYWTTFFIVKLFQSETQHVKLFHGILIFNKGGKNEEDPAVPVTTGQAVRAAAAAAAREVEVEVEIPKPVSRTAPHRSIYHFY